jgi:hypothetical protein
MCSLWNLRTLAFICLRWANITYRQGGRLGKRRLLMITVLDNFERHNGSKSTKPLMAFTELLIQWQ